jgi:hypothetical protein
MIGKMVRRSLRFKGMRIYERLACLEKQTYDLTFCLSQLICHLGFSKLDCVRSVLEHGSPQENMHEQRRTFFLQKWPSGLMAKFNENLQVLHCSDIVPHLPPLKACKTKRGKNFLSTKPGGLVEG